MRLVLALATVLVLTACSTGPAPLPKPDGQVFRLNAERWPATVNDISPRTVAR